MVRDNQQRINKLNAILEELAGDQQIFKNQQKYNDYYMKLKGIYVIKENEYWRHSYNEIFSKITELNNGNCSIEILGQNIKLLYEYVEKKGDEELKEKIHKLYDHVSLDIARINYVKYIDKRLDLTGDTLEKKYNSIAESAEKEGRKIEDVSSKIDNVYSQFVSILGIFSAVVLVFFGGITIVGDVITTLKEGNIFIGIFICILVGLVGFNIIFMFLYVVSKLTGRPICNEESKYYYGDEINILRFTYPIVAYYNFFSIMALILDAEVYFIIEAFKLIKGDGIFLCLINSFQISLDVKNCLLLLLFIIVNFFFFIQYLFSKIMDINIGFKIQLRYHSYYVIEKNGDGYAILQYGDNIKNCNTKLGAAAYKTYKSFISKLGSSIYNFFLRVIFRYPYMAFVNVLIFICLILVNLHNIRI